MLLDTVVLEVLEFEAAVAADAVAESLEVEVALELSDDPPSDGMISVCTKVAADCA